MNISGITPEEYFTYYCKDEIAKEIFKNITEDNSDTELEDTNKRLESISEQVCFANELIESIEYHLERETRMSEFKKTFRRLIEDSMFER